MKKFIMVFAFVCVSTYANADSSLSTIHSQNLTQSGVSHVTHKKYRYDNVGPKPFAWCGWFMRTLFGGGAEYNLARNWAKRGHPVRGPQIGAVVVWPHHVGVITGKASNGLWVVKSGNDSGRVRERARSVAGAIAFRVV